MLGVGAVRKKSGLRGIVKVEEVFSLGFLTGRDGICSF
jgi:hypothetical protein